MTSYEKIKGRAYSGMMFEFGPCVLYKTSAKVEGGNMQARWAKGIWLGKRFATEEHIIATTDGTVARSGAVKLHPEIEYDSELFDGIIAAPWDPVGKNKGLAPAEGEEQVKDLPKLVVPRVGNEGGPAVRRVLITRAYVQRFGPTPDCSKCRAILAGDNANPTLAHSRDCRVRMEGLLALDPVLAQRLDRAQSRQDDYLARRVEAGDE